MDELESSAESVPATLQPWMTNLDGLSIADLEEYIGRLEQEIARARAVIIAKQGVRRSAESLFNL